MPVLRGLASLHIRRSGILLRLLGWRVHALLVILNFLPYIFLKTTRAPVLRDL